MSSRRPRGPFASVFVGAHGWIFQEADAVGGVALRGRPRDELALEPLAAGDAAVGEAVGGGAGGAHGEVGHADVRGFDGDQIGEFQRHRRGGLGARRAFAFRRRLELDHLEHNLELVLGELRVTCGGIEGRRDVSLREGGAE